MLALRPVGRERVEGLKVRPDSVAGETVDADVADDRDLAEIALAVVDVGEVNLRCRQRDGQQSVANRVRVVRERRRIDDDGVGPLPAAVQLVDDRALMVRLKEAHALPQLARVRADLAFEVAQRLASVDRRLAFAQQVEVRAVDDQDVHVIPISASAARTSSARMPSWRRALPIASSSTYCVPPAWRFLSPPVASITAPASTERHEGGTGSPARCASASARASEAKPP